MKSLKKIKGFVLSITAMSVLFSVSMNANIKNIKAADSDQKTEIMFDREFKKRPPMPNDMKKFEDMPLIDFRDKTIFDKDNLDFSLNYETKDYLDNYNRVIGSYPVINNMQDLSNQILSDIDSNINEFDLKADNEIYDSIVGFSIEQKNGYAKISVVINNPDDNSNIHLEYYLDIVANKQVSSDEYLDAINNINKNDDHFSDFDNKINDRYHSEIIMVPLRTNAEKFGWTVDWKSGKNQEPSRAILKKDNRQIEILVDADLDYDLIINDDSSKGFVKTIKLDRKAELQDNLLYVPSSFLDKFLIPESWSDNGKNDGHKRSKKDEIDDANQKRKPRIHRWGRRHRKNDALEKNNETRSEFEFKDKYIKPDKKNSD